MHVRCVICSDLFVGSENMSTTACGHVFHCACLGQWIERSNSCPQCRSTVTKETTHRIYLQCLGTESEKESCLQDMLENLKNQIEILESDMKRVDSRNEKLCSINEDLRNEVKALKTTMSEYEDKMNTMKFESQHSEKGRIQAEIARAKAMLMLTEAKKKTINVALALVDMTQKFVLDVKKAHLQAEKAKLAKKRANLEAKKAKLVAVFFKLEVVKAKVLAEMAHSGAERAQSHALQVWKDIETARKEANQYRKELERIRQDKERASKWELRSTNKRKANVVAKLIKLYQREVMSLKSQLNSQVNMYRDLQKDLKIVRNERDWLDRKIKSMESDDPNSMSNKRRRFASFGDSTS